MLTRRQFIRASGASIILAMAGTKGAFAGSAGGYKRVFVSDIHMSYPGNPFCWLTKCEAQKFTEALTTWAHDDTVDEVILLGDIMDTWVWPIDEEPPRYKDILESNPEFLNGLKTLSKNRRVIYVPGNHDMTISSVKEEEKVVTELIGGNFEIKKSLDLSNDGIVARHGHEDDLFNMEDEKNEEYFNLPFGYYISRLKATLARDKKITVYDDPIKYLKNTDNRELMKKVLTQRDDYDLGTEQCHKGVRSHKSVPVKMIDYLTTVLYPEKTESEREEIIIKMPYSAASISIKDIKKKYFCLCAEQPTDCQRSIDQDIFKTLKTTAVNALDTMPKYPKIVIYGHSHKIDHFQQFNVDNNLNPVDLNAVYVNCGCWCENEGKKTEPLTYVEIEKGKSKLAVRIKEFKSDDPLYETSV